MEGNKEAKQLGVTWIGNDTAGAWQVCPRGTRDSSGEAARSYTQGSPLQEGRGAGFLLRPLLPLISHQQSFAPEGGTPYIFSPWPPFSKPVPMLYSVTFHPNLG